MKKDTVRILTIEDNPADFRIIQEYLGGQKAPSFTLEPAETLESALDRLAGGGFDLILLDLNLPDSMGLGGLDRVVSASPRYTGRRAHGHGRRGDGIRGPGAEGGRFSRQGEHQPGTAWQEASAMQ